ncbi:RICIN domain-containing protein [Nonomuraea sp. K274]|uniref:RICIN domain-containing protein n=2 Tax=Nonomuraea cypriaca TaxID=1187855 RepID=A0A931APE3_9ACTN|nr:RICIN domain-containing protein [Nonomuraea cypriaca]
MDRSITVKPITSKGLEMRNHRLVTLLSAVAITTAAGVAAASPAQAEDPIVKLVSGQNRKCLQPDKGSLETATRIVQQTCNGSLAQQWTVTPVSSTKVHLVNRASKLCLDVAGKAVSGTPIQQWTCNWISNENWGFGITDNLLVSAVSNTWSHCIATPGAQDGLPMELRFCDGNSAQRWNRPPG